MKTKIIILIIVAIAIIAGLWYWFGGGQVSSTGQSLGQASSQSSSPASSVVIPPDSKQYADQSLGFSFYYPSEGNIQEMPQGSGYMVVVSDPKTSQSLQVYVTPFSDSPDTLTADSIQSETGLPVNDPSSINGLPNGGQGISFSSTQDGDPVLEYWFAVGGRLYQLTAASDSAPLSQEVLKSFQVQNNAQ